MKNFFLHTIIICSFFFFSCKESKKNEDVKNKLSFLEKEMDSIGVTDIFHDFEYIALETNDESIIGEVSKILIYDNKYYLLDKTRGMKVYVFNDKGDFIRSIGKKGKGPGEYLNLEDFTIDESSGHIVLLGYPSIVYVFDSLGQFVKQKKLTDEAFLWNICRYDNRYFLSSNHQSVLKGNEAFLIFEYDNNFNLRKKSIDVLSENVAIPPFLTNPFLMEKDRVNYFDTYSSKIYTNIDNNQSSKCYNIDLEGRDVPIELYANPQDFFTTQGEYRFYAEATIENNILYMFLSNCGSPEISLIDIATGESFSYYLKTWFPYKFLGYAGNNFYSSVDPYTFNRYVNVTFSDSIARYPISDDSNPVIIKYKSIDIFK